MPARRKHVVVGGLICLLGACVSRNPLYEPSQGGSTGGLAGAGGGAVETGGSGGDPLSGTGGAGGMVSVGGQGGEQELDGAAIETDVPEDDDTGASLLPDTGPIDTATPIDTSTTCTKTSDCAPGRICSANFCHLASDVLVVDNFDDGNFAPNTMGGWVSWANQTVSVVAGEARLVWNGKDVFQTFVESFIPTYCAYDLRPYRKLRFRMRTLATTSQAVRVFLARTNTTTGSTCAIEAIPNLRTITVTTVMQNFDFDISTLERQRSVFIEIGPPTNDAVYFLDDIHLLK
jgi:hypothetical protein